MGKIIRLLAIPLAIWACPAGFAATWYVDDSVVLSGDGKSWATAFKTIQQGINAAKHAGDTVLVARGVYVENVQFKSKNIALRSTDPLDPLVVRGTVIDGGDSGPVVTFTGDENETCLLAGFTIRNGRATWGAGIRGGGSLAAIQYNTISQNIAVEAGGGLYSCNGLVRDNTISNNSAGEVGGGLCGCDGLIAHNVISGNSAALAGGGLFDCNGEIQYNIIVRNTADSGGGASSCKGVISNNIFAGNVADNNGGAVSESNAAIVNNTMTANVGRIGGAALYSCPSLICNCIFWLNVTTGMQQLRDCAVPTCCCIEAWTGGGTGNIDLDPRFVDFNGPDDDPETYLDNDYRLASNSPCIDAGMNQEWMREAVDFDGNPRIFYGGLSLAVDMGAYEYGSWPFKIVGIESLQGGEARLTWISRPGDTYLILSSADVSAELWLKEGEILSQGDSTTWTDSASTPLPRYFKVILK